MTADSWCSLSSSTQRGFLRDDTTGALVVQGGSGLTPSGIYIPGDGCLLNARKAAARARNGGRKVRVNARGDSTTYGVLSGTNPSSLVRSNYNWLKRAQDALNRSNAVGRCEESIMHFAVVDDARFSYTGGGNFGTLVTGQTMVSAMASGYDAFDLCILRSGNAGDVVVTGAEVVGSPLTLALSGVTNNQAATFRVPMSSTTAHTFTVAGPASGTAQILNLEPVLTTNPPILGIGGVGISGQTLATLAPGSTGSGTNMEKVLRPVPDVLALFMGINDMRNSSNLAVDAVAYGALVDLFATACIAQGTDPVLIVWPSYFSNLQGLASATEGTLFQQTIYDVARSRNCAVIDLQKRWGQGVTPTTGFASTPVTNSALYDGTHPTLLGYWDIGEAFSSLMRYACG